jgi:hypothetical protein
VFVRAILAHVEEAARTSLSAPRGSDYWYEGCGEFQTHFVVECLWDPGIGAWALPVPLPRAVLKAFNSPSGGVRWRCEACRTGLGSGSHYPVCPVCGSARFSPMPPSGSP